MRTRLTVCDQAPGRSGGGAVLPSAAAVAAAQGKIVFTTHRDGNAEIYSMNP